MTSLSYPFLPLKTSALLQLFEAFYFLDRMLPHSWITEKSQLDLQIYSAEFFFLTDLVVAPAGLKETSHDFRDYEKQRRGTHKHFWVLSFSPLLRAVDNFLSVLSSALVAWSSWSNWFSSIYYPFLETQANPQSSFWGSASCDFSPVPSCQFGNCWQCTHCLLLASSLLTSRLWLLWWSAHDCLSCFVWIKAKEILEAKKKKKKK